MAESVVNSAVNIVLNGQARQLAAPLTIAQLLTLLQIPTRGVAVEVNQEIVPRQLHDQRELRDGDELEIVSLVGGG